MGDFCGSGRSRGRAHESEKPAALISALADPLRTFATTRARPGAPRGRSGAPERPGNPLESSHGALSVARCQSRAQTR
jgi:hypothetical protein